MDIMVVVFGAFLLGVAVGIAGISVLLWKRLMMFGILLYEINVWKSVAGKVCEYAEQVVVHNIGDMVEPMVEFYKELHRNSIFLAVTIKKYDLEKEFQAVKAYKTKAKARK